MKDTTRTHIGNRMLQMFLKAMMQVVYVALPMLGMSVVLYDMSINGLGSVSVITILGTVAVFSVFRAVSFVTSMFDDWSWSGFRSHS